MERLTFDARIIPSDVQSGADGILAASAPHVPGHAVTHGGIRTNRISARESEGQDRNRCNSPDGSTKIFWNRRLGADPRAPWNWSGRPHAVDEDAPDTGSSGPDGTPCPDPWPDTVVGHARLANAEPPVGRPHCNIVPGDDSGGTASRIPSTGTADAEDDAGQGLEPCPIPGHAEAGPRERRTPKRSSRGAEPFIPLRDAFYPLAKPPAPPTPTRNHSNRHQPIASWLPWLRENGSLPGRRRQPSWSRGCRPR
jgi:hypothetical protein